MTGLKIDFVFRKTTPHAALEFSRRRLIELLPNLIAWIAAPEDVIISKLRYFREGVSEKHISDIRGILANTEIDQNYLEHWIGQLELESQWNKI